VRGEAALARGDRSAARAHLLRATELDPGYAPALLRAGRLLLEEGELAAGRRYLERAIAADPGSEAASEARRLLDR
ncbi:MAG TPA: tetratricopeptide repeat protein, partial [Thermoanaerobaculia bacterium]|nr:tetratricopeptide repeat protein [Thermoanaerobaculia bacterium]